MYFQMTDYEFDLMFKVWGRIYNNRLTVYTYAAVSISAPRTNAI